MVGSIFIRSIQAKNLLSFGRHNSPVRLEPLNLLIGPNGAGKSNFLSLFRILRASATDLTHPFLGGGFQEWVWKGNASHEVTTLVTEVDYPYSPPTAGAITITHVLGLTPLQSRPYVGFEYVTGKTDLYDDRFSLYEHGDSTDYRIFRRSSDIVRFIEESHDSIPDILSPTEISAAQSILSQRDDPSLYPQLNYLARKYKQIAFSSGFASLEPARKPQDAGLAGGFLNEDYSNLALVVSELSDRPDYMKSLRQKLNVFYERVEDILPRVVGGAAQIHFQEAGLVQTVPATRLSDGTLRYLCLLLLLTHPNPPPLLCIEEPELGMHPDIIPTIADLLIDASTRTQLVVATHSEQLVSAIGRRHPEAVLVCERGDDGSMLNRLEPDQLADWLTRYSLGDLWLKGEIGGTRW